MSLIEICIFAVALAMDCFTVSMVFGVLLRKIYLRTMLSVAILFGLFQAVMPLIGWAATNSLRSLIEDYDHWIAFGLLAFLGGKMIKEAFADDEADSHFNPQSIKTQLLFAVATSIDALAVGISFVCIGYRTINSLLLPTAIIGFVSFAFSIIGMMLGIRFGRGVEKRIKPELIGGIVLICIGIKVLIDHLCG